MEFQSTKRNGSHQLFIQEGVITIQVVEDPNLRQQILDIIASEYNLTIPREGMHASDLIYCLTRSFWNKVDPLPATEDDLLRFSIGLGLERVIIQEGAARPSGYFEVGGITLTPDFILQGVHSELKTTRFSPGKWSDTWIRQIAAYCFATDQLVYNLVVLHIIQPALKAYRVFFSQEELEDNWEDMMARKSVLETALLHDIPPKAFAWNEQWECNGCRYKLRCDLAASIDLLKPSANVIPFPLEDHQ